MTLDQLTARLEMPFRIHCNQTATPASSNQINLVPEMFHLRKTGSISERGSNIEILFSIYYGGMSARRGFLIGSPSTACFDFRQLSVHFSQHESLIWWIGIAPDSVHLHVQTQGLGSMHRSSFTAEAPDIFL